MRRIMGVIYQTELWFCFFEKNLKTMSSSSFPKPTADIIRDKYQWSAVLLMITTFATGGTVATWLFQIGLGCINIPKTTRIGMYSLMIINIMLYCMPPCVHVCCKRFGCESNTDVTTLRKCIVGKLFGAARRGSYGIFVLIGAILIKINDNCDPTLLNFFGYLEIFLCLIDWCRMCYGVIKTYRSDMYGSVEIHDIELS